MRAGSVSFSLSVEPHPHPHPALPRTVPEHCAALRRAARDPPMTSLLILDVPQGAGDRLINLVPVGGAHVPQNFHPAPPPAATTLLKCPPTPIKIKHEALNSSYNKT